MKTIIPILLCALLCALSACRQEDPCAGLACSTPVSEDFFKLRILSAANNSTDLLFGPARRYNPDSLRLYSFATNGDTVEHILEKSLHHNAPPDSLLEVVLQRLHQTAYLHFPDGDIDTLALTYETRGHDECCGPFTTLTALTHNGGAAVPFTTGIIMLVK